MSEMVYGAVAYFRQVANLTVPIKNISLLYLYYLNLCKNIPYVLVIRTFQRIS